MGELSFGNLISETINAYPKIMSRMFVLLLVVIFIPLTLLDIVLSLDLLGLGSLDFTNRTQVDMNTYLLFFGFILVLYLIYFLMYIITVNVVKGRNEEKKPSISEYLKLSFGRLLPFLILAILQAFALGGLLILLVIPMIIMAVYWLFASTALIYDNKGVIESLKYSMNLVKGKWWRTFGYMLLFTIIMFGVGFVPGFVIGILSVFLKFIPVIGPIITSVLSNLLGVVLYPIGIIFIVLFYEKMKESKGVPSVESTAELKAAKPTAEKAPAPTE